MQLPYTHLDMGDSANMSAILTIDQRLRWTIAIAVCIIMILVTLPTTITRVAMFNLDCLVVRQAENPQQRENGLSRLRKELPKNRVGTTTKTGTAVCCGAFGLLMVAVVIVMILLIVLFGM